MLPHNSRGRLVVEFVLIWIGCGILCAVIAPGKGRSPAAWFFLGLIFSVFAVVAVIAMPNLKDAPQ